MYPFDESTRKALQWALPAVLVLLALAVPWLERGGHRRGLARAHLVALGAVCLAGFGLYTNQNWEKRRYFNPYEFFHYYVGAKYAPELGYTRLYDAVVLVDRETGFVHRARDIANLNAHRGGPEYKRLGEVYAEEAAIRAPFTPERWAEFTRDVVFFREQLTPALWEQLQHDKGYNATPLWTLVGGTLANLVPARAGPGLWLLVALDPLLLALGFGCVAWAFGLRAMLFALACYLTHYCTSHAHFRAAFLRTDWLAALLAAMALAKKEKPLAAGVLVAWAALVRVFPVLFACGPLAVLAWAWFVRLPERRAATRFAAGLALGGTIFLGLSLLAGGLEAGLEPWREFGAKIAEHDQRPASDTLGFRHLFLWTLGFEVDQGPAIRARFEERALLWWTLQATVALAVAWVARRRTLEQALGLGFVLVWFLAAPAYYYYALLLVPLVACAARAAEPAGAIGLALVFATSLGARAVHGGPTFEGHFAFKLSALVGVLALWLFAEAWLADRRVAQRAGAAAGR
jgi:hypothetical protein